MSGPSSDGGPAATGPADPRVPLTGKTAIVVDDGIATGSTARAACQVARAHGAARVVLAVPVAPQASLDALASSADEVLAAEVPEPFLAIGQWYQDFTQTSDAEVVELLRRSGKGPGSPRAPRRPRRPRRTGRSSSWPGRSRCRDG